MNFRCDEESRFMDKILRNKYLDVIFILEWSEY